MFLKELTKRQGDILEKASDLCSHGGTLMYATCSLFKDENERVIENFLKSNTEFFVQPLDNSYVNSLLEELKESVFIDKLGGVTLFDPRISKYGFYFINLTKKC
jgi:16S rRNA C967 or C1407 C5-methylase (RsmB/RsmF family)